MLAQINSVAIRRSVGKIGFTGQLLEDSLRHDVGKALHVF
jgi:hypothetical protein